MVAGSGAPKRDAGRRIKGEEPGKKDTPLLRRHAILQALVLEMVA
jgi:hypothetical protein